MANQWAGEEMWSRSTDEPFELQVIGGREGGWMHVNHGNRRIRV